MRISPKAAGIAGGLLWGGALLFVSLVNIAKPSYGAAFLQMASSIYPWFHASGTARDVLMGALDGLVDGGVAGFLFAWLYNLACPRTHDKPADS